MAVTGDSILPHLVTWVMIYSSGINIDFAKKSHLDPLPCNDLGPITGECFMCSYVTTRN